MNTEYQQQPHNELDESNEILEKGKDRVTYNSNDRDTCLIESLNSNTEAFPDGKKTQNDSIGSPISTSTCTSSPSSDYVVSSEEGLKKTSNEELLSLRLFHERIGTNTSQSGTFSFFPSEANSSTSLYKGLRQNMDQQKLLPTQNLNNINDKQLNLNSNLDSLTGSSENPRAKLSTIDRYSKEAKLLRSLRPNVPKAKNSTRSKHTYRFSITLDTSKQ